MAIVLRDIITLLVVVTFQIARVCDVTTLRTIGLLLRIMLHHVDIEFLHLLCYVLVRNLTGR